MCHLLYLIEITRRLEFVIYLISVIGLHNVQHILESVGVISGKIGSLKALKLGARKSFDNSRLTCKHCLGRRIMNNERNVVGGQLDVYLSAVEMVIRALLYRLYRVFRLGVIVLKALVSYNTVVVENRVLGKLVEHIIESSYVLGNNAVNALKGNASVVLACVAPYAEYSFVKNINYLLGALLLGDQQGYRLVLPALSRNVPPISIRSESAAVEHTSDYGHIEEGLLKHFSLFKGNANRCIAKTVVVNEIYKLVGNSRIVKTDNGNKAVRN